MSPVFLSTCGGPPGGPHGGRRHLGDGFLYPPLSPSPIIELTNCVLYFGFMLNISRDRKCLQSTHLIVSNGRRRLLCRQYSRIDDEDKRTATTVSIFFIFSLPIFCCYIELGTVHQSYCKYGTKRGLLRQTERETGPPLWGPQDYTPQRGSTQAQI